jgi:zinc D-Ala-D-Ala carboxypeptidase
MPTHLSTNFTLEELTFSQIASRRGLDNQPNLSDTENLTRLCEMLLEPARKIISAPLHIDSGYRSPAVNASCGGAPDSAHMVGRAADLVPIGLTVLEAFDALRLNGLPFDQLIFECQAWIHIAVAAPGNEPRRQVLIASGYAGHWKYFPAGAAP